MSHHAVRLIPIPHDALADEQGPADALLAEVIDDLEMVEAIIDAPDHEVIYRTSFRRVLERSRRKLLVVRQLVAQTGGAR